MLLQRPFFRGFSGFAVAFCAFLSLFCANVHAENSEDFQRDLIGRSERYLDSQERRCSRFPAQKRQRLEAQARKVVENGFANLRRKTASSRAPRELGKICAVLESLENSPGDVAVKRALEFLKQGCERPPEFATTLYVALPDRFYRKYVPGIELAKSSGSDSSDDPDIPCFLGGGTVVPFSSPSRKKSARSNIAASFSVSSSPYSDGFASRLRENDVPLRGFVQIAQTVVLRI